MVEYLFDYDCKARRPCQPSGSGRAGEPGHYRKGAAARAVVEAAADERRAVWEELVPEANDRLDQLANELVLRLREARRHDVSLQPGHQLGQTLAGHRDHDSRRSGVPAVFQL